LLYAKFNPHTQELNESHEGWKLNKDSFKYTHGMDKDYYNLDFDLDPRCYDIYAGLEPGRDRIARVHLTGWWKLRRIPDTMSEATWDPEFYDRRLARSGAQAGAWRGGEELPENDVGLKEQFWRPDYDDSQWCYKFVPWNWNYAMGWVGGRGYGSEVDSGVGWYRRTFTIGDVPKGHRVLLHFEYINTTSTVWVNGEKIGSYTIYESHPGGWNCRGVSAEQHEYDITHAVKPGAENQVTVRVFDNGLVAYGTHFKGGTGGIWQPCWVDIVPGVRAESIYCTPRLKDSALSLRCFMNNAGAKDKTLTFRAHVSPWKSYRYTSPVADAQATVSKLGARTISPGRSEVTFELKMESPIEWDLETPFLYHVQLYATETGAFRKGREKLIGQARFGFREFKVDGAQFRLNGKRCFLPGIQINEPTRGSILACANYKNWSTRWFQSLRGAGVIFMRWHSGHFPSPFFDTADEVGYLLDVERLLAFNYDDTPEFEASVKRLIDNYHNHPSVVMHSFGNEHFSGGSTVSDILKWSPTLSRMYDLYKKYDPTRPITPCSGSSGMMSLSEEDYDKWAKTDYHDNHDYTGGGLSHIQTIHESIPRCRNKFNQVMRGKVLPYVNLECGTVNTIEWREKTFDPLQKTFPKDKNVPRDLDRKLYAETMNRILDQETTPLRDPKHTGYEVSLMGLGTYLHEPMDESKSYHYREMVDLYRIHGMDQVGFNLHALDGIFGSDAPGFSFNTRRWRYSYQSVYDTLKQKLQPFYAACPKLTRNCFAGKPLTFKLIAMNDSFHDVSNVSVSVAITDGNDTKVGKLIRIPSFTQEQHHNFDVTLNVPASVVTGHYRLLMTIKDEAGKTLGWNEYPLHILGEMPPLKGLQKHKVLVYTGQKGQGAGVCAVLDRLGVGYSRTRDLAGLDQVSRLLVGPGSFDDYLTRNGFKLLAFLRKGGRLIVLAQDTYDVNAVAGSLTYRQYGGISTTTDLVTPGHPVFSGLNRRDFHVWNGITYPTKTVLKPITPVVLAAATRVVVALDEAGMSVGEIAVGKGAYLFSQIQAVDNCDKDSVAAHYLYNLIRYCVSDDWTGKYAVEADLTGAAVTEKFKRPDPGSCFFVDLREHCNRSFTDEVAGDTKGGWSDDGAKYDMRVIPVGKQTFQGVPFDIIDPVDNNGKSCIALAGHSRPYFPKRADRIIIGRKIPYMYLLISSTWTPRKVGEVIGKVVFHYRPGGLGTTMFIAMDLTVGKNIEEWTDLSNMLPDATVAFKEKHPLEDHYVGALLVPWINPIPSERIDAISVISTGKAVPVVIAITGATRTLNK